MPERFVLDANVLYTARLRDLFLELRVSGIAQVFWTEKIEAEWTRALVASRPDLQGAIEKTVRLIRMAFPLAYLAEELGEPIMLGVPRRANLTPRIASGRIVTLGFGVILQ